LAYSLARESEKPADSSPLASSKIDPDLAWLVTAWPDLPEAIRRGIVAMVEAAAPAE